MNDDYQWLDSIGICHKCRKNKQAKGKKFCLDCLEKIREESRKRYDPEKAKEYQKRRRELYKEHKEKGICVRCERPAKYGIYCYEHYIAEKRKRQERNRQNKRERHERGLISTYRKENNLCLWCGKKALPGLMCCEKHRDIFIAAGKKSKEKDVTIKSIWNRKSKTSRSG